MKTTESIEKLLHGYHNSYDTTIVEALAMILHEAGREAVEKRVLVGKDSKIKEFLEWDEIDEEAKEGRRIQARYLIKHDYIDPYRVINVIR